MKPKSYWQNEALPEWATSGARVSVRLAGRAGTPTMFGQIESVRVSNGAHVADIRFDDGFKDTYDFFWIRPLNLIEAIGELDTL